MDRFKELTTFVDVAQRGSLSAAAREEGITPAMVGRRIDQLEERLGVKLFKRSTRKVTLTPEGSTFYEDCHRLLDELRGAEDALSVGAKSASGRLIITAPTSFGRKHIAPHLAAFIAEHPNLHITLHLSERLVDLKNERFDVFGHAASGVEAARRKRLLPVVVLLCGHAVFEAGRSGGERLLGPLPAAAPPFPDGRPATGHVVEAL